MNDPECVYITVYENYAMINCNTYRPASVSELKKFFPQSSLGFMFSHSSTEDDSIGYHLPSCLHSAMFTYLIHGGLMPLYYNIYDL
ncbi:hypothetical protein V1478_000550 [Vespula squamosa]|uniref:Uncharacterized protein n=1 Tax=Vespula squamosa TaxID=30214 RepID=A0ABD2C5T8_VESSQ